MTSLVTPKELCIDKIQLSLRLGKDNFGALNILKHLLRELYIHPGLGKEITHGNYPNSLFPPLRVKIPLAPYRGHSLFVECGAVKDWHQTTRTYAKFSFNVSNLARNPSARQMFRTTLDDLIPSGGYPVLLEEGYVLSVEFSADYRGITPDTLDAYSPLLEHSLYFLRGDAIETINLHDEQKGRGRNNAFCIYDKKQADWKYHKHLRRGALTRIEAIRRLNRTPTYRELHVHELDQLPNPFTHLRIYERSRINQTFTAARHMNFLRTAQRSGVQVALANTRGADRDRRIRMLGNCCANWWNPSLAWEGVGNALQLALLL